jgi:hypothetical protein
MVYVKVANALLVPTIGAITTYVACQQYKTARENLRYMQYDRRSNIYGNMMRFITTIMQDGGTSIQKNQEFLRDTREAHFLLDSEMVEYVDELYHRAIELWSLQEQEEYVKEPGADHQRRVAEGKKEILEWFSAQLTILPDRFRKYLGFPR